MREGVFPALPMPGAPLFSHCPPIGHQIPTNSLNSETEGLQGPVLFSSHTGHWLQYWTAGRKKALWRKWVVIGHKGSWGMRRQTENEVENRKHQISANTKNCMLIIRLTIITTFIGHLPHAIISFGKRDYMCYYSVIHSQILERQKPCPPKPDTLVWQ